MVEPVLGARIVGQQIWVAVLGPMATPLFAALNER
jgi:hypothetical protein